MLVVCRPVTEDAAALLTLAMWPDPARIRAALGRYASDPELQVWGWQVERRTVCAAGLRVIRIPDDQLYIVIPLTPWIEGRKSVSMSKPLIIDNYLTGIRIKGQSAEILHIGTRADSRQKGHARNLLLAAAARLNLSRLDAETDDGAAPFYRRAGFDVRETAGRGGTVRYHCTLSA